MPYMFEQPTRQETSRYVVFKDFLSPGDCERVIDLSRTLPPTIAKVGNDKAEGSVDVAKRRTKLFWFDWTSETDWLISKMAVSIAMANQKWWGYHLNGFKEQLQLTHYSSEDQGFYDWHEDHDDRGTFVHRKLSVVIQLNDGFEGGGFEFYGTGTPPELGKGTMIIFPSFRLHRVVPVTKGERWSLVSWINGPPFV